MDKQIEAWEILNGIEQRITNSEDSEATANGLLLDLADWMGYETAVAMIQRQREIDDIICCCGSELDGSHDHNTCGPPIPRDEARPKALEPKALEARLATSLQEIHAGYRAAQETGDQRKMGWFEGRGFEVTTQLENHPEWWDCGCNCETCRAYGDD